MISKQRIGYNDTRFLNRETVTIHFYDDRHHYYIKRKIYTWKNITEYGWNITIGDQKNG